jgi:hypothetical protein
MSRMVQTPVVGGSHHGKSFPITGQCRVFKTLSADGSEIECYARVKRADGKIFLVHRPQKDG